MTVEKVFEIATIFYNINELRSDFLVFPVMKYLVLLLLIWFNTLNLCVFVNNVINDDYSWLVE